jgi:hypothetical protein
MQGWSGMWLAVAPKISQSNSSRRREGSTRPRKMARGGAGAGADAMGFVLAASGWIGMPIRFP